MGKTQGVKSAAKPQRIAVMIELQSSAGADVVFSAAAAAATPGIAMVNSTMLAVHWLPSLVQMVALT